jgi:beta-N-acetylhexosaminidase
MTGCKEHLARYLLLASVLGSVLVSLLCPTPADAQTPEAKAVAGLAGESPDDAWLDEMLEGMTTADKIGQLFLVTFEGNDIAAGSDIARLIQVLRVGGVMLSPANANYDNAQAVPEQVLPLTGALQGLAFSVSSPITFTRTVPVTITTPAEETELLGELEPLVITTVVTVTEVVTFGAQGIPLVVAVNQEGDGYPNTDLRSGFTEVPSSMAIGASWNDENAEAVGLIVGSELEAVGVNLLLGPSLDVLRDPRPGLSDHLSTRVYGGDPFWTGRMGQAYVRGVHLGSDGRVAVVAKHLPGLGASDRSLEEEVATVDRSLQDLRLVELPPFFAVIQSESITDTADALMTAHIRYRGFQGNIRYVTPPISLHPQGMEQIMAEPELASWRESGGVLVSDSLGVPAIRRYYSPELDAFPHRQIALDAFLAGNDLLNLSRFSLTDSWDEQMENIEDTVLFFRSRYGADENFRARVDDAVRRILLLKHRICPEFSGAGCVGNAEALGELASSQGTMAQVSQQAVTLLYPSSDELALRVPRPPRLDENLVIFTDAREARDCAECPSFYMLDPELLRDTILRMYGPEATEQVDPERITAFTFNELESYLALGSPDLNPYIRDADWIIFAMLNVAANEPSSSAALKQFLRERAAGPETQKLVVMAYEAPYYLDTTEISKLTAYYGIYGKSDLFVETSVRALFQEFGPTGQSPVTVEGLGYDLVRQLSPDPGQVIAVVPADQAGPSEGTPQPLSLEVGDSLDVRTSVIVDHNGNPVPDGTPVTFHYVYLGEGLGGQVDTVTQDGVADATITLELEGDLQVTATSDPANNSRPVIVRLSGGTTEILTPTPTATPTSTPTATPTFTPTPTPTPTSTPTPTVTPIPTPIPIVPPDPEPRVEWLDLALALLGMVCAAGIVFLVGQVLHPQMRVWNPSLRLAVWSLVCGLAAYLFYGLALPGSGFLEDINPGWRGFAIGFAGGLLPLVAVLWMSRPGAKKA